MKSEIKYFFDSPNDIPRGEVTAFLYARVSTRHTEQESSLAEQERELIEYAAELGFVAIAICVEKETAKNDISREGYLEMLNAVQRFRPTYIIAKSRDRLVRSQGVNSQLMQICAEYGTKLKFYMSNEETDPTNATDIVVSGINAVMDENYSNMQHEKSVRAHESKCKHKRLSAQNNTFGYRYNTVTNEMEIFEPEAVLVRRMFEMRVYEDKGCTAIAKYFADLGITSYGTKDKTVSPTTILKYLKNEAYIGTMYINTQGTHYKVGVGVKSQRYNRDREEWVAVPVPPIVDKALFDLAQKVIDDAARHLHKAQGAMEASSRFRGSHVYASKVFCGSCGNSYIFKYSDRKEEIGSYICSERKKVVRKMDTDENGEKNTNSLNLKCTNPYRKIYEETLNQITMAGIGKYKEHEEMIYSNLFEAIKRCLLKNNKNNNSDEKQDIKQAIKEITRKMKIAEEKYLSCDSIRLKASLEKTYDELAAQLDEYNRMLKIEEQKESLVDDRLQVIQAIKEKLDGFKNVSEINREVAQRYIDRIIVNPDGTLDLYFQFNKCYSVAVPEKKERPYLLDDVGNNSIQGMMEVCQRFMPTVPRIQ